MPKPDIALRGDFTVNKNHGARLRFSSMAFDAKGERLVVVYEMHDGDNWLGPKVIMKMSAAGGHVIKLDGTQKDFPGVDFNTPAIQALLRTTEINAFLKAQGGDLRTEL